MRSLSIVITLLLCVARVSAQELPSEAVVSPISKSGVTEGCSVTYTAMARDNIYKNGGIVGVSGSVVWTLHPQRGLAGGLKVAAADVGIDAVVHPFRVAHGFMRVNGKVFQVEQKYDCEKAENFCGVIGTAAAMDAFEAFAGGGEVVSFGFNRKDDGMDVSVPLPTLNPEQSAQLSACMLEVLDRAKAQADSNISR